MIWMKMDRKRDWMVEIEFDEKMKEL